MVVISKCFTLKHYWRINKEDFNKTFNLEKILMLQKYKNNNSTKNTHILFTQIHSLSTFLFPLRLSFAFSFYRIFMIFLRHLILRYIHYSPLILNSSVKFPNNKASMPPVGFLRLSVVQAPVSPRTSLSCSVYWSLPVNFTLIY